MTRRFVACLLAVVVAGWGASTADGVTVERYSLKSRFVHRTLPQAGVLPPGSPRGRPLLVFLHGRGADGQEANANRDFYRALARQGSRAPAVVFPSGTVASYWHRRHSGDWARYVLDEVIPEAARRLHADPSRVAIGGISMGGYGAFEVARRRPASSAPSAATRRDLAGRPATARRARSTTRPTSSATGRTGTATTATTCGSMRGLWTAADAVAAAPSANGGRAMGPTAARRSRAPEHGQQLGVEQQYEQAPLELCGVPANLTEHG